MSEKLSPPIIVLPRRNQFLDVKARLEDKICGLIFHRRKDHAAWEEADEVFPASEYVWRVSAGHATDLFKDTEFMSHGAGFIPREADPHDFIIREVAARVWPIEKEYRGVPFGESPCRRCRAFRVRLPYQFAARDNVCYARDVYPPFLSRHFHCRDDSFRMYTRVYPYMLRWGDKDSRGDHYCSDGREWFRFPI